MDGEKAVAQLEKAESCGKGHLVNVVRAIG